MSKSQVLILLAMLAEQSGEKVSESRVDFVGSSLLAIASPEEIAKALHKLLRSSRRFPTVAEVEQEMGMGAPTQKDEALLIADTIIQNAIKFGWLQPGYIDGARAREACIGAAGWEVIKRQGGWNNLLERLGENQMALRAQLRDVTESYLKTGLIEPGTVPLNPASVHKAIEAAQARPLELEEHRRSQAKLKLTEEIEGLKQKRRLAQMQEEHDARRLPDPDKEEPLDESERP